MRKIIIGIATVLTLVLAGCKPTISTFDKGDIIGADAAAQTALQNAAATGLATKYRDSINVPGTPLNVPTFFTTMQTTFVPAASQKVILDFTNGIVDSASLAGIALYNLSTTAAVADAAIGRGTAIAPTATAVIDNKDGTSKVILTYDFSAATNTVELVLSAATLTANSGTNKLDANGNTVKGEAIVDDLITYLTVQSGSACAYTGADERDPQGTVTVGTPTWDSTTTYIATASNSNGSDTNITAASLSPGYSWAKLDTATGTWTALAPTATYATGTLTWTFPTAIGENDLIRVCTDVSLITESAEVRGSIHKAGWAIGDARLSYSLLAVNGRTNYTNSLFASATDRNAKAVATAEFTSFDWLTTNQSFKVRRLSQTTDTTVTLNLNATSAGNAVTAINAALTTAGISTVTDLVASQVNGRIILTSGGTAGADDYFVLSAGTVDALATMKIAAGVYTGANAVASGLSGTYTTDKGYIDFNFARDKWNGTVNAATIVPAGLIVYNNTTKQAIPWVAADLTQLSSTQFRLRLSPAAMSAAGTGTYKIRVLPSVVSGNGFIYNTTNDGKGNFYAESGTFTY